MAQLDADFLEGDRPGQSFDLTLVRRAAAFVAPPQRRRLGAALFLILAAIGLELAMPSITRDVVDSYLVPSCVKLQLDRIPGDLKQELLSSSAAEMPAPSEDACYLVERQWRRLDPALVARLRAAGAVDAQRWYRVDESGRAEEIAARRPGLFMRSGGALWIADSDLQRLSKMEYRELRRSDARGLMLMALLYGMAAAALLAVSYCAAMRLEGAGQQVSMDLRVLLYRHALSRSLVFFSRNPTGKLVTRINNDAQAIAELFCTMMSGFFKDILLFVGIAVAMLVMNARLAAVCLLIVPFMAAIAFVFARVARRLFRRVKGYTGLINTLLQETLSGMTAVKLMGAQAARLDRLVRMNSLYFKAALGQVKMFAVFTPLMELVGSLAVALIIWRGGGSVIQDRLSLGTLVAFVAYMQMLLPPIRDLCEKYNQLQGALTSVERIFAVLDVPDALTVAPADRAPARPAPESDYIRFQSVGFGYRQGLKVFESFDLTIASGQTVALVGGSGAGKSTLVNLLLRLYDPDEGMILLGGRDLKSFSPRDLAGRISLVSQEIVLLAASVEENIILGRNEITPRMFENAVGVSGVGSWIEELAEGIHTRIGEGGRRLSQGQCQMLALARALAGNPELLVLDEAFSQIDPDSERAIVSRLPAIMSGRTCITIAHRLSTARHSQRILVMRAGRIVEDGDHRTLMALNGVYAGMVALERLHRHGCLEAVMHQPALSGEQIR